MFKKVLLLSFLFAIACAQYGGWIEYNEEDCEGGVQYLEYTEIGNCVMPNNYKVQCSENNRITYLWYNEDNCGGDADEDSYDTGVCGYDDEYFCSKTFDELSEVIGAAKNEWFVQVTERNGVGCAEGRKWTYLMRTDTCWWSTYYFKCSDDGKVSYYNCDGDEKVADDVSCFQWGEDWSYAPKCVKVQESSASTLGASVMFATIMVLLAFI